MAVLSNKVDTGSEGPPSKSKSSMQLCPICFCHCNQLTNKLAARLTKGIKLVEFVRKLLSVL